MKEAILTGGEREPEIQNANRGVRKRYLAIVDSSADTISIVDGSGMVRRFAGVIRDAALAEAWADELRSATESVRQLRVEAASANSVKDQFLAVVGHELRTPLTAAAGFVQLLAETEDLNRTQRRYIDLVKTANAALLTVIDDILDFSVVEHGQLKLDLRAFSLSALIQDTVAIAARSAASKNLAVTFTIVSGAADLVVGDSGRLRQVLLNLLNNAIKFTVSGSITLEVRARISSDGRERMRFCVADTGTGIPPALHQRVFEAFSQADGSLSRRHGGVGLGLAICRRLVYLMDGEIGIISDVDRGASVWFTASLPHASGPALMQTVHFPAQSAAKRQARILVVDDAPLNCEIVEAYLTGAGYNVDAVGGAAEAIRVLKSKNYDLVLMDIQMPVMDGLAATRCIRSLPDAIRDIPIIAMTGHVFPAEVRSYLEAGMNGHVGKPIDRSKLFDSVRRCLLEAERDQSDAAPIWRRVAPSGTAALAIAAAS